jgi:nucleoside recognition membrane protein YjiH
VAQYKTVYSSALAAGEGMSGGAVSLLGLIQYRHDTSKPLFSPTVFFFLVACLMVLSLIAFSAIFWPRMGKGELVTNTTSTRSDFESSASEKNILQAPLMSAENEEKQDTSTRRTLRDFVKKISFPLTTQFVINFIQNGINPSITTYTSILSRDFSHF